MRVPVVSYLALTEDGPRLQALECSSCHAHYFDRRNQCARCGDSAEFGAFPVPSTGVVRSFTIVHRASPNVSVPFVSAVIELDSGDFVKANLHVPPDPDNIPPGIRVEMRTFDLGTDDDGNVAVALTFVPLGRDHGQ